MSVPEQESDGPARRKFPPAARNRLLYPRIARGREPRDRLVLIQPEVTNDHTPTPTDALAGPVRGLRPRIAFPEGDPLNLAIPTNRAASSTTAGQDLASLCARVAEDNKARDVIVLDMRGITLLYDYFVLANGTSRRQVHTLVEEIDAAMRAEGERRLGLEGYEASKWVVQDYGDVVVHIFDPEARKYYSLEELWADAPHVDWQHQ